MKKVLIIDDAEFYRAKIRKILNHHSFIVLEAETGEKGLILFKEERPDLVILDNILPGIQGIGVLKIIKQGSPKAKVIVVSSASTEKLIKDFFDLGADAFIKKPHDDIIFLDNVFRILEI